MHEAAMLSRHPLPHSPTPTLHPRHPPRLPRLISTIGLERGLDTLTWQLIASVAAPGYTIHTLVAIVSGLLQWAEQAPEVLGALHQAADALGLSSDAFLEAFNKSVPTACGLLGAVGPVCRPAHWVACPGAEGLGAAASPSTQLC